MSIGPARTPNPAITASTSTSTTPNRSQTGPARSPFPIPSVSAKTRTSVKPLRGGGIQIIPSGEGNPLIQGPYVNTANIADRAKFNADNTVKSIPRETSALPVFVLSDSYKLSHGLMYKEAPQIMDSNGKLISDPNYQLIAYGEPRNAIKIDGSPLPFSDTLDEHRIVCYGIRYIIENYIDRIMTEEDFAAIDQFFFKHFNGTDPYPYARDKFRALIGRKPPIKIYALEEGTVILPHTPVYKIVAEGEYAELVTFFETVLTMVWYPMSVATLSRCCRQMIENTFETIKVPNDVVNDPIPGWKKYRWWIDYMLQDFGFRGCTTLEQSVVGGTAHLVNFMGSDTMSATFYSQFRLNNGQTTGVSIPASEHSVMTSYAYEKDAMVRIMEQFGNNVFAMVMDSYNYVESLTKVFPAALKEYLGKLANSKTTAFADAISPDKVNDEVKGGGKKTKRGRRSPPRKLRGGYTASAHTIKLAGKVLMPLIEDPEQFSEAEKSAIPERFKVVFRPDSGNPYLAVVQALEAGLRIFGIDDYATHQSDKLYVATKHSAVIQGDGINAFTINAILKLITQQKLTQKESETLGEKKFAEYQSAEARMFKLTEGSSTSWAFSPMSVAFGMGGGLLQKINRDTLNFATKLCYVSNDGTAAHKEIVVMKDPITDPTKRSLPGNLSVILPADKVPTVISTSSLATDTDLLKLAYDGQNGGIQDSFKVTHEQSFQAIKDKVQENWTNLASIYNESNTNNDTLRTRSMHADLIALQNTTSYKIQLKGASESKQYVGNGKPSITLFTNISDADASSASANLGGGKRGHTSRRR